MRGKDMWKPYNMYLTAEQIELIDNCLWKVKEAISIGLADIDEKSEMAKIARHDLKAIEDLRGKLKKDASRIKDKN